MNSENTHPACGIIDPAAIALIGTYAIDLTETTHSNIAVHDMVPTTVS
jgi:hypothetical protein